MKWLLIGVGAVLGVMVSSVVLSVILYWLTEDALDER